MAAPSYRDTALYYCVDDVRGATIDGASLNKVLICLRDGGPVSGKLLYFLQEQDLDALHGLASGALTYDSFREVALAEQARRIETTAAAKREQEAEEREQEAEERARKAGLAARAEAERLARESDPKYIARIRNKKLRTRYGIAKCVDAKCFPRLMNILKLVDAGARMKEEDVLWLSTAGKDYFSDKLASAYHQLEADFFATEFKKTRDPWMAVNASSHYRKCDRALVAVSLIESINVGRQASPKLKSALCTTHGGALRDLQRRDEAIHLGEQAHEIAPKDYRPCTLLGALHMEGGNFALGQEWYEKALERGANVDSVDQEIRRIFFRADKTKQEEMRALLLREDPDRFSWARKNSG